MATTALTQLPDIDSAKLPATYVKAKDALAKCDELDECQEWSNKAQALASYAKQAKDDSLERMAMRIHARAVRRCGELLKQIPANVGRPQENRAGAHPITRTEAAEAAGLSDSQKKQALRVASVPEKRFEAEIESAKPATVSTLARIGTKPDMRVVRKVQESGRKEGFAQATEAIGTLKRFAEFCEANDPKLVAHGVESYEVKKLHGYVAIIDKWMDVFDTSMEG